jgi:hypothetical protein
MIKMIATQERKENAVVPALAIPTAADAISFVNGWLHAEIGMAVNVSQAYFNALTYTWHLPIQLAFPDTGPVGVIGDVFLHAGTGQFVGVADVAALRQRAECLAESLRLLPGQEAA